MGGMSDDDPLLDDDEPVEGELLSPEESAARGQRLYEAVWEGKYEPPPPPEAAAPPPGFDPGPSLVELLETYNGLLGWDQTTLAKHAGIDQADINRIFRSRVRPRNKTLERIAVAYTGVGQLSGVSLETLVAARDRVRRPAPHPFDIPAHWRRLLRGIQALPVDDQDALHRIYSAIFNEYTLMRLRQHTPPAAGDMEE